MLNLAGEVRWAAQISRCHSADIHGARDVPVTAVCTELYVLGPGGFEYCDQGHAARKWLGLDLNPILMAIKGWSPSLSPKLD